MILVNTIEISVNGKKVKHYESLGYNIPKWKDKNGRVKVKRGTIMSVKIEDLPTASRELIPYKCDYCEKDDLKPYVQLLKGRKIIDKDCCEDCIPLKIKETNLIKYGVEHTQQLEETKSKFRETNLKVRGVEYPSQSQEVREKVVTSYLDRYGETNPMKNEEIKNKHRETMIEKYGVSSPIQDKEIKNKIRQTNRLKYGVDNPQQNKEIKEKTMRTMNENGTTPCSIQQKYIHNLIGGVINFPLAISSLDIAFPDEKIYIEYDGSGHWLSVVHGSLTQKEFELKEIRRSYLYKVKVGKK